MLSNRIAYLRSIAHLYERQPQRTATIVGSALTYRGKTLAVTPFVPPSNLIHLHRLAHRLRFTHVKRGSFTYSLKDVL